MSDQGELFPGPKSRQDEIVAEMVVWILADRQPWREWERITLEQIARGRTHLAVAAITELVRYETSGEKDASGVRIRNAFRAYLGRLFEMIHPEHAGIFQRNKTPSAHRPATGKTWHISQVSPAEEAVERKIEQMLVDLARDLRHDDETTPDPGTDPDDEVT